MSRIVDVSLLHVVADRHSWSKDVKTYQDKAIKLVATQKSRRKNRKGRTTYIYHIVGTNEIVFNNSRNGVFFIKIALPKDMPLYEDIFVNEPLTVEETKWLKRYDYVLEQKADE